ncbi:protein of unknown function DUF245 domain protein [Pirellula staleyi DSM 6068]|uniref:Uncharacterized protein n=1 Tax=Pirellula staleyi (strain ATCC 27377 / DSM 6068 / ICPB 4128) TaxID=530564 RepID=D2R3H0_PIRSD|nr:proteasome accessory factor PafA2 family protein [Pirellula staleyi]ADB15201.1 protein of unknown function DUF245 domain protein [Pirellula staleyi DSM 6068]
MRRQRGAIFERLVGLETEYALLRPATADNDGYSRFEVFRALVASLRTRIPAVAAQHFKEGVFHAAGGAVWFETERISSGGGLVEGSSPECRGPMQVLIWQKAQDKLLAAALDDATDGETKLIKNDRDAFGNVYGAQENYEATLATGWRLLAWRASLIAIFPIVLLTWLSLWIITGAVMLYALAAVLVYLALERLVRRPQRLAMLLFGCSFERLGEAGPTGPQWMEQFLSVVVRVIAAPLAGVLLAIIAVTSFCEHRKKLLPFLASRAVIGGSGMIDDQGRFLLADKATAMNCSIGFGGLLGDRPIFTFGHFYKTIFSDAWMAPGEYFRLFSPRQRLQIGLGDSNLCDVSQYLRVGTTLLVLDMIEAGEATNLPQLRSPLRACRKFTSDPTLQATAPLRGGGEITALEVQRAYLEACRQFLAKHPEAPEEAFQVLSLWDETLKQLAGDRQALVGSIDWVTKQRLIDENTAGVSPKVLKKIDIKYHELSSEGYFQKLLAVGLIRQLTTPAEVERAMRCPPSGTPAAVRGQFIREFASGDKPITANWHYVLLGRGRTRRIIKLSDYRPLAIARPQRPRAQAAQDIDTE